MSQNSKQNFSSIEEDDLTGSDDESYSENDLRRGSSGKSSGRLPLDKNSEEYKRRREKNNEAVRRSREKAKIKYTATEDRIQKLRAEKKDLESKVNGMKKELNVLQELAKTFGINPEDDQQDQAGFSGHNNNSSMIGPIDPSVIKQESGSHFGYL